MTGKARIYQPTASAMQSGRSGAKWVVEFDNLTTREIEPIMGWTSNSDPVSQLKLEFPNKEAAIFYAKEKGIEFELIESKARIVKPKSYSSNFTKK